MIIYAKNAFFFLFYSTICCLILTNHISHVKGFYFSFFPMMMIYYLCMIYPKVHMYYIYYVTERHFVWWKVLWQMYYHGSLTYSSFCVATLVYMVTVKEIIFLLKFSEKRLAKIEESIEEKAPEYRIAHLHLDVFQDDINNRFHRSCFNTNRLYLLESTNESKRTQLGISNYRDIRRKNEEPRDMNEEEQLWYKAASNEYILLENRHFYILLPILALSSMLLFTLDVYNPTIYVHILLIVGDISTYIFTPPLVHEVLVDVFYGLASVLYGLLCYKLLL